VTPDSCGVFVVLGNEEVECMERVSRALQFRKVVEGRN